MSLRRKLISLVSLGALAAAGCAEENGQAAIAKRDDLEFTTIVMPVLLRDCGFPACHGSQERFFRVYGPGRTRLRDENVTEAFARLSGLERDYSLQLALSMIDPVDPGNSLLLRKPLAVEAGGAAHEGVDKYGRNVYRTPDDDGYLKIARWVFNVIPPSPTTSTPPATPVPVTPVAGAAAAPAPAPAPAPPAP